MVMQELSYPSSLGIELTNYCNCACIFCPLFSGEDRLDRKIRPVKTMSMELFANLVRQIAEWSILPNTIYLNLHGEPLLDKQFTQRLNILKKYNLAERVDLQTNAMFLDEKKSQSIIESGISRLTIGFDGASKKIYESHRIGCKYEVVLNNLKKFVSQRFNSGSEVKVAIQYVHTPLNSKEVYDAYLMFSKLLNPETDCFQDTYSLNWASKPLEKSGSIVCCTPNGKPITNCPLVPNQMMVFANGLVPTCCWDYNMTILGGPVGDAKQHLLLDIWRGQNFSKIRKLLSSNEQTFLPDRCRDCVLIYAKDTSCIKAIDIDKTLVQASQGGFTYYF